MHMVRWTRGESQENRVRFLEHLSVMFETATSRLWLFRVVLEAALFRIKSPHIDAEGVPPIVPFGDISFHDSPQIPVSIQKRC